MAQQLLRMQRWILIAAIVMAGALTANAALPSCYHTRAEIDSFLIQLVQLDTHNLVTIDTIGHSRGGMFGDTSYPLYSVRISAVPPGTYAPSILIVGQVHAEEVIGVELTLEFMRRLVTTYGRYRYMLENTQLYFVPTANPDGLEVVSRGLDDTYRKNGYHPPEMASLPCNIHWWVGGDSCGVDINRNFGLNWIYGDTLWYPTANEIYDYYRGPAPWSEPETRALRDLGYRIRPTFSIVYHSSRGADSHTNNAEKCIMPWEWRSGSHAGKHPPDSMAIKTINNTYAQLLRKTGGGGPYDAIYGGTENGDTQDWFYRELGTIQFLTELGPPITIQPDSADLWRYLNDDMASLEWFCWGTINDTGTPPRDDHPGPTPLSIFTYNAQTRQPISAEYRNLNTYSPLVGPWYTDPTFGGATFIPPNGTEVVMARKEGFVSDTDRVSIPTNQMIRVDTLWLTPLTPRTLTVTIKDAAWAPVAADIYLDCDFPKWVDAAGGFVTIPLWEGHYRMMVAPRDGSKMVLWRDVDLTADRQEYFVIGSATALWQEDFSGSLDARWQRGGVGDPWRVEQDTSANHWGGGLAMNPETFRAPYLDDLDATLTEMDAIALTQDAAFLDFDRWGRMDVPADSFFVEVLGTGDFWTRAAGFCDRDIPWTHTRVNLTPWAGQPIHFRFRAKTDSILGDLGMHIDNIRVMAGPLLATPEKPIAPAYTYRITGSYPNPFNPTTTINYEVAAPGRVKLVVFNTLGEEVRRFDVSTSQAGPQRLIWDGTSNAGLSVSSGLYYVQLQAPGTVATLKIVLLR